MSVTQFCDSQTHFGMLELALGLVAIVLVLAYFYFTSTFNYWRDKGVVFVKPYPLVGSMWRQITLQEHMNDFFRRIYFQYTDQPYVGFYQGPVPTLLVRDADLIKNILVKDFSHFTDHGLKISEKADPLMYMNLFHLRGQKWKDMRAKFAPTFTSGRLKSMFPLVLECANTFESHVGKLADAANDVELKDLFGCFTTNVIASNIFGISCDSFNEPNNTFRQMSRKLMDTDFIQGINVALIFFIPGMSDLIKVALFKQECEVYFRNLMKDVMNFRSKTGETRNDFVQLLIELMDKGFLSDKDNDDSEINSDVNAGYKKIEKLTENEAMAQAFVFFFAGFETSSLSMAYALFELARRPDLQKTARQHILEVLQRHDNQITYEALQDMTYLDWILQETLRKYPTLAIFRECTKNYIIPGTKLKIEKGTALIIPNSGLHYDSQYFPDPEEFIPERFSDEEMVKRNQYVYLPFGEGPRLCIGKKLANMQSKVGLLSILHKFEVRSNPKTKYPLAWDARRFLLTSKQDVIVNISRIQ
ncbi:hypothetical protein B566_EDAN002079 [Ephemera danica]|nr:hypothetical protein B566_EDAN002079 [Ephemera danica]